MKIKHSRKKEDTQKFCIGALQLKNSDKYKYLGHLQNDRNNNEDHIKITKAKTEAAFQKMMSLTGSADFMQIEMETIWTVIEACIIPIIIYGGEAWQMTEKKYKLANQILDNILSRKLKMSNRNAQRSSLY